MARRRPCSSLACLASTALPVPIAADVANLLCISISIYSNNMSPCVSLLPLGGKVPTPSQGIQARWIQDSSPQPGCAAPCILFLMPSCAADTPRGHMAATRLAAIPCTRRSASKQSGARPLQGRDGLAGAPLRKGPQDVLSSREGPERVVRHHGLQLAGAGGAAARR